MTIANGRPQCGHVTAARVWQATSLVFLARIYNTQGRPAQKADISAIQYAVIDHETGALLEQYALDKNVVIYDALQTDEVWLGVDEIGYNFRWDSPFETFPEGDKSYRLELRFTEMGGARWSHVFLVLTKPLHLL